MNFLLIFFILARNYHLLMAIHASDMDALGSTDRVTAAGTDIFAAAGWLRRRRCGISAMTACAGDRDTVMLIPGDKNVSQVIFEDKVQQFLAGVRDCPTILRVMLYN